jgi:hypothetical protein
MKRLLDASGGTIKTFHHSDDTVTIQESQDVEPILEHNKRLQTENDGYSPSRDLRRVASIPSVVLMKWCQEAGISMLSFMRQPKEYRAWLRRKIYDRDNYMFLTAPHTTSPMISQPHRPSNTWPIGKEKK